MPGDRDLTGTTLVVTGANGFVGGHVIRLAAERGADVIAVGREPDAAGDRARFLAEYVAADLASGWPVDGDIDAVVHLAGLAAVGPSFAAPQQYIDVNSKIMTHLGESLLARRSGARVVVVSSGSVYAPPVDGRPVDEGHPVLPGSPYAISKLLVESQATYYASRGVDTVTARPFNHIGPGQDSGFLVPDLAELVRRSTTGGSLRVGDLGTARDYTDVRDVARAYLTLAFAPSHRHPVYNVASGVSHTGWEVLDATADALGRPTPDVEVDVDRIRPNDVADVRGSARRLRDELGWEPAIDWRTSIRDFVGAAH